MKEREEGAKNNIIKLLAIIGLIAIIASAVWLSVQIVRVFPGAFTSLASIADIVYKNRPIETLEVMSDKEIANSGEAFKVTWTDFGREGDYYFSYMCQEGVSLDTRTEDGRTSPVACGTSTLLSNKEPAIYLTINSERQRFVDVPYTVAFTAINEDGPLFERNNKITVINASIPQSAEIALENGTGEEEIDADTDAVTESTEDEMVTVPSSAEDETSPDEQRVPSPLPSESDVPGDPAPLPVVPGAPGTNVATVITPLGESFSDLRIRYLGVGIMDGDEFTPSRSLTTDERGAIRFEVKNIGTRISGSWTFEATLPSGYVYNSDRQLSLRSNESALFTIGFDPGDTTGSQDFEVSVETEGDANNRNNSFTWSVEVED